MKTLPWCARLILFVLFLFLLGPGTAGAQEEEEDEVPAGERPSLSVGALTGPIILDGIMDEPAWSQADSITNLTMVEPEEGEEPSQRTVVRILASEREIVVGVWAYDDEPDRIVAFNKARDSELENEDHIALVFDSFLDMRTGYYFAVNPAGARFEGLVEARRDEVNSDWDAIWEAKTSRNETGWGVEIRLPIKSLVFQRNLTTWGLNVERRIEREQEISRWAGASQDYDLIQTSRAGRLTDLPAFNLGVGLSVRPSLVGKTGRVTSDADTEFDGDASLDVSQRIGPNILSNLTVNTDFAETEVDVRQINLTRFPLFYPEKRTFFLEGSDIYEFGLGLDEETVVAFHSRRIGLPGLDEEDQEPIPINAGGKINGRVGNTNLAALVVNTRKVDSLQVEEDEAITLPSTTMGSFRISQNILEESSIGAIANFGDQLGRADSWLVGADFAYRTSNFLNEKNFVVGAWGMLNDREDLAGDKSSYGFRIDYPNDLLDINFTTMRVGDGFDPSLSFVPRRDFHLWDFGGEFNPRPAFLPFVRQMFHELSGVLYNERDNSEWQSYQVTLKPFHWLFESGDELEFSIEPQGDRPPEEFEVADGVIIPDGSYEWTRYIVGANTAEKRWLSAGLTWESGGYYNGDLTTLEGRLTFRPSALLTLEATGERNVGNALALDEETEELVEQDYTEQLFGLRLELDFSADLQFSSLTQYDTESKELGTNNRLRWTFTPFGELFIVYNHNMARTDDDRWEFVSNQLPIKIQYTWRF